MALDLVIYPRENSEPKALPLSVLLGDQLKFGCYDKVWRLAVGELGHRQFVAYDPACIGRGFTLKWQPGQENGIAMRLLMPASRQELRTYFDTALRVMAFWQSDCLYVNGSKVHTASFEAGFERLADYNNELIHKMTSRILSGQRPPTTLVCALYPLTIGPQDAQGIDPDPEQFGIWLHAHQKDYPYYASPRYFRRKGQIAARYNVNEDILSVVPAIPAVPYGTIDRQTGKQLECHDFGVYLISSTLGGAIAELDYDTFLARLPRPLYSRFDENTLLLQPLSLQVLEQMAGIMPEQLLRPEPEETGTIAQEQTQPANTMNETGVIPIPKDPDQTA